MSKYEITKIRSMDNEVRYVIYNKEEHAFFAGYDFMGGVDWEYSNVPSEACELTAEDDPEQIVKDLESADEPDEPETSVRENAGYEIIQSLRIDSKHEIVIGRHPTAPAKYVCWDCTNGNDYNNGGYTMNYRQALAVLAERITSRYDSLPVEF